MLTDLVEHYKIMLPSRSHHNDWQKYIVNTAHTVDNIDVHNVWIEGICDNLSYNRYPKDPPLLLNHYSIQSKDFFLKNKASRGDVNNWVESDARNEAWFKVCDINDIYDDRLKTQNKNNGIAMELDKDPVPSPLENSTSQENEEEEEKEEKKQEEKEEEEIAEAEEEIKEQSKKEKQDKDEEELERAKQKDLINRENAAEKLKPIVDEGQSDVPFERDNEVEDADSQRTPLSQSSSSKISGGSPSAQPTYYKYHPSYWKPTAEPSTYKYHPSALQTKYDEPEAQSKTAEFSGKYLHELWRSLLGIRKFRKN